MNIWIISHISVIVSRKPLQEVNREYVIVATRRIWKTIRIFLFNLIILNHPSFKKWFTLPRTFGRKGGSRSKATRSPMLAVRQQPLILKSPHVATGICHIGSLQEVPHNM
jgi:hypothetical protein